ncbi:hypothetical protein [Chryseobacterium koreense]
MERIVQLSKIIKDFRDSGKDPAMIYVGSVFFKELLNELEKRVAFEKNANIFFFAGIQIEENKNIMPLEVSIMTADDIKVMDFNNFKKHLHLL